MLRFILKASQLGFSFQARKPVQHPGERGGKYYYDAAGKVQYGERPVAAPSLAASPAPPPMPAQPASAYLAKLPERAKTVAEYRDRQAKNYEVLEGSFLEVEHERRIARMKRSIEGYTHEIENGKPPKKRRELLELWIKIYKDSLEKPEPVSPNEMQRLRESYIETVKKALSTGLLVPRQVIAQRLEFTKARDARERYEKGRHTSFANVSVAVNDTMQAERGYKVKRQDGKPISQKQIDEIARGMDEIEAVLGPLGDQLRKANVTIAHTNGKHPFLSDAGGMYSTGEKTVSVGIRDFFGHNIPSLAHELAGHWLDYEAGSVLGKKTRLATSKSGTRRGDVSSLAEAAAVDYGTESQNFLREARRLVSQEREVRNVLSKKLGNAETDEEKSEIQKTRVVLGPYWYEAREVFARLVEQYVAYKSGGGGWAMEPYEKYCRSAGYWTKPDFEKLVPAVEREIAARLKAIGVEPKFGAVPTASAPASAITKAAGWWRSFIMKARLIQPDQRSRQAKSLLAELETRRTGVEKDLLFIHEEDLPQLDGREDGAAIIAKAAVLRRRGELLGQLRALDGAILKARQWKESQHPRVPKGGGEHGGEFVEKHRWTDPRTGKIRYDDQKTSDERHERVHKMPALTAKVPKGWLDLSPAELRKAAEKKLIELGDEKRVVPHAIGEIHFRKESEGKAIYGSRKTREELLVTADLPRLLSAAEHLRSEAPNEQMSEKNVRAYHYLGLKVKVGADPSTFMLFNIKEDDKGHLYYNHSLVPEILKSANPAVSAGVFVAVDDGNDRTTPPGTGLALGSNLRRAGAFFKRVKSEGPVLNAVGVLLADKANLSAERILPDQDAPGRAGFQVRDVEPERPFFKSRRLHGRRWVDGLHVSIENRKGSVRQWTDAATGEDGRTKMRTPYGYIRETVGADGEQVDVFLGPLARTDNVKDSLVYLVTTNRPPDFTELDEQKVMIGYPSLEAAKEDFIAHYDDPRFLRQIDALTWPQFKEHVRATKHFAGLVRGEVVHRPMMKAKFGFAGAAKPMPGAPSGNGAQPNAAEPQAKALDHDELGSHLGSYLPALEAAVEQLSGLFAGAPVAGRLRETASIAQKAAAGGKVGDTEDLASVRITLENLEAITAAAERIKRSMKIRSEQDFTQRPMGLGYRAYHLVAELDGVPVEIQLRTKGETAWADYVHDALVALHGEAMTPELSGYVKAMGDYIESQDKSEGDGQAPECPPAVEQQFGAMTVGGSANGDG